MQTNHLFPKVFLGPTKIKISPMGIGAWAWGDRFFWSYGKDFQRKDIQEVFDFVLSAGISFVDTAEIYGLGKSERIIGNLAKIRRDKVVLATKLFPFPWRIDPFSATRAVRNSLRRLQTKHIDLYQIHMPGHPFPITFWLKKIAAAHKAGFARAVGVSNYNLEQTRRAREFLASQGIPLASNQVRYNLLDRRIEKNGLLDYCQEHKITVISYSPLAMGMLTGKYTSGNPPQGVRRHVYAYTPTYLQKIQKLTRLIEEIGAGHGGKSPAQVALNWTMCKGTVPIPGAKTLSQAQDNTGALGWRLTADEISALDQASDELQRP